MQGMSAYVSSINSNVLISSLNQVPRRKEHIGLQLDSQLWHVQPSAVSARKTVSKLANQNTAQMLTPRQGAQQLFRGPIRAKPQINGSTAVALNEMLPPMVAQVNKKRSSKLGPSEQVSASTLLSKQDSQILKSTVTLETTPPNAIEDTAFMAARKSSQERGSYEKVIQHNIKRSRYISPPSAQRNQPITSQGTRNRSIEVNQNARNLSNEPGFFISSPNSHHDSYHQLTSLVSQEAGHCITKFQAPDLTIFPNQQFGSDKSLSRASLVNEIGRPTTRRNGVRIPSQKRIQQKMFPPGFFESQKTQQQAQQQGALESARALILRNRAAPNNLPPKLEKVEPNSHLHFSNIKTDPRYFSPPHHASLKAVQHIGYHRYFSPPNQELQLRSHHTSVGNNQVINDQKPIQLQKFKSDDPPNWLQSKISLQADEICGPDLESAFLYQPLKRQQIRQKKYQNKTQPLFDGNQNGYEAICDARKEVLQKSILQVEMSGTQSTSATTCTPSSKLQRRDPKSDARSSALHNLVIQKQQSSLMFEEAIPMNSRLKKFTNTRVPKNQIQNNPENLLCQPSTDKEDNETYLASMDAMIGSSGSASMLDKQGMLTFGNFANLM